LRFSGLQVTQGQQANEKKESTGIHARLNVGNASGIALDS
jgi:hypothetical protein